MKLNQLTIKEAADGFRRKEFSVTELVSACLSAIHEKNKELHAYLTIFEGALSEAKKLDGMLGNQTTLPPLFGIPLAIKDNIMIAGERTTAGSKILENHHASYSASVIERLKNHGAIFLGKTNLDEFAMGSSTENSAFGPTKNPHDISRVPGGSSGGSAAAVAGDLCLAALGSDTGGSIRQPASFCGVVGLKPTYGSVSRHGLIAMASSLDQIGPFAKTVSDAHTLFEAISGSDGFDSTAAGNPMPDTNHKNIEIKKIKIGVPKEYFSSGLESDVEKIIKDSLRKLESMGVKVEEISLPHSEYALSTYYIVVPSEVSANLARFDGIRYGMSVGVGNESYAKNLYEVYTKTRGDGFGSEVKRRIMLGTYALSAGYYDAYYLKAQKVRRLIKEDFARAFEKVDVILGPTTPTPAFKIGEKSDDPLKMYLADIYTVALNLAGIPGISLPAGWVRRDGKELPVGLQLISNSFEEQKLFAIAEEIEKILNFRGGVNS